MQSKLITSLLLNVIAIAPMVAIAGDETAVEAVEAFYHAATVEGMCDKARQIRPDYTNENCENLKSVKIRTLKIVKENEDETEAIIYLNMQYKTSGQHSFKGHLHLFRKDEQWIIIGSDYRSRKAMSRAQYIRTFMGKIPKEKELEVVPEDTLSGNHQEVLKKIEQQYPQYAKKNPIVLIDTSEQEMYLYIKKQLKKIYPISTSVNGEGSEKGSEKTPLGAHIIREKFGKDATLGTIFVGRQDTGEVADIIREAKHIPDDYVTSRILWLDGLEKGKNKGGDVDSYKRFIYIHGTAEEGLIGRKASHGCIRMYNRDVIKLFDKLPIGSVVYIGL